MIKPDLLLMDEPLSNLDAKLRVKMRVEIRKLQQQFGITAIYVTHDQEECFAISDKVAIMNQGVIEQLDTPDRIYNHPETEFIARFVRAISEFYRPSSVRWRLPRPGRLPVYSGRPRQGRCKAGMHRPEDITIAPAGTSLPNPLEGDVMVATFLGKRYQYNVSTALGEMVVSTDQERTYRAGERVTLSLAPNKIILI